VRVRQALSLAINRKAIVERVLQNTVTEANQWMPKGTFGYNPEVKDIPYNVEQAKKLLAEAGFPQGFQLTIHVPGDRYPQAPETVQAVAQFWTRAGVKTQVQVVPWSVYSGRATKNEFAVSVIAWGNGTGEAGYGPAADAGHQRCQARPGRQQLGPLQQRVGGQGAGCGDGSSLMRGAARPCSATRSSWSPTMWGTFRCSITRTSGRPKKA
jgi:ABC-type transport system substrate-binding protein